MTRKHLSADAMTAILRKRFEGIPGPRGSKARISNADALMTAMSAFAFKFDSFNTFYERLNNPGDPLAGVIGRIYKIDNVPSPTRIKEIIDPLPSESLMDGFKDIFRPLQRGKVLESCKFLGEYFLVAGDGSQYFESKKIHCKRCIVKNPKNGETSYSHQMYAGCIIHPDMKQVIPLAPEPIQNGDGGTKNDCERNASARFLERLRKDHPKAKFVITEDGLSSNAPHIRKIKSLDMSFILGAKPGDHKYLFDRVGALGENGDMRTVTGYSYRGKKVIRRITRKISYANGVPLNGSNHDLKVNFLGLEETVEKRVEVVERDERGIVKKITHEWKKEKTTKFSWVTDIKISDDNALEIMRGGRKRWAIENETFNVLKNMGHNWEHNYGHGEDNLATNFALLMMLAFAIDQVQELCCPLFRRVLEKFNNTRKHLWIEMRSFLHFPGWAKIIFESWTELFNLIVHGPKAVDSS